MTPPTVTIVTPSYNQGEFIRATIESVLAQDYPQLQYIVMDGGSTDQTAAIVAEYAGRLTWISEKDRGQAHAINKGFQMANGEIVAWLNSDDILLPGAVARAVDAFRSAPPRAAAIYGEGYLMDRAGRITRRFPATEPFNLWKLTYLSDYILQQSAFFRRAAVAAVGWLDEGLHYAMDWDLFIRIGRRYGLHYVPEYLGVLREYREAKSFAGRRTRIEEIRRVLERHTGLKRAPGFWIYYLDDRQRAAGDWLESHSPRLLETPIRWCRTLLRFAADVPIFFILKSAQHLDRDRSVGRRLKWMLPEGSGEIVIQGSVPDDPRLAGQTLAVLAGGRSWGRWPIGPGAFALRFAAPAGIEGPVLLEVRAARAGLPEFTSKIGVRRVAWVLDAIQWASDCPSETPAG